MKNETEEPRLAYAIIMAIVIIIIGFINNMYAQSPIHTINLSAKTTTILQTGRDAQQQTKVASTSPKIRCYSHEKLLEQISQNSALQNELDLQEQNTNNWILKNANKKQNGIITIPVVVHVLYNTSDENISYSQIQSQLDVLNQDFRKSNSDAVNVPSAFSSYAADAQIEFCLASSDENGNATSGITRTSTSTTSFTYNDYMKYTSTGGIDAWPTDKYLNIWVCDLGTSLLGYAQFPGTGNYETDGVVINYIAFGTTGTVVAPYHLGRTTTHEVGHWLNLRHIWGDDSGACTGSDYVTDTPEQANYSYGCNTFPYTDACSTTSPGIMFMNYMDYSDDDCVNMFSSGQASRMLATLKTTRAALLTSNGCSSSTSSSLTADFTANKTAIYEGESIQFYDASGGSPSQWEWKFSNAQPYTSSFQNPTVTYYVAGNYEVNLSVSTGSTTDSITKTAYITVYPKTTLDCDTLSNFDLNNDTISLYKGSQWGFVAGHNWYGDLAFADYFYAYPSGSSISSVILGFGYAKYASSSSNLKIKVWDNTGSGGSPGNELYSQDVLLSSIYNDVLNGYYTVVNFSSPVQLASDFYLGIEITYSAGDTVALYSNSEYTGSPCTAWSKWSDNNWYTFVDGWAINSSLLIRPVLCQQEVDANFQVNSSTIKAGETVTFQDLSTGSPTSWSWTFDNGSPSASSLQNPSVTYYNPGVYTVYLWAGNSIGSDTAVRQITVEPNTDDECFALSNYDYSNDQSALYYMPGSSGYLSGNNGFLDRAKADYFYTYPSGKELSGVYLFFAYATYSSASSKVKIKVWDNSGAGGSPGIELGSEDVYISTIVTDILNVDYTGVSFSSPINISTPFYVGVELPTQAGDSVALLSNTISSAHPGTGWEQWYDDSWHSYSEMYGYELTNVIVPVMCNSSAVTPAPTADFAASSTLINVGDTISFTDLSSGSPSSWQWSFNGANTTSSSVANPSGIIYNTVGTYSVTLIASNFNGSDTITKTNYINESYLFWVSFLKSSML
jgi:PKD repeat protein